MKITGFADPCGFIAAALGLSANPNEKVYSVYIGNKFFADYPASTAALVVEDLRRKKSGVIAIDAETGEIVIE